ncbi:MAG: glycosyl hydrolase [Verrucomicrobiota bacterium]
MNKTTAELFSTRCLTVLILLSCLLANRSQADPLERDFNQPPIDARLRAYWWWLNGNVTKEAITRDLEQMQAKGFGGAVIFDADGASQAGNAKVPPGPTFGSPEWRELFKHAVREADRLGLELSLNIQSGWNLGGPTVTAEDAPKKLVWTEQRIQGGAEFVGKLEAAKGRDGFYRDLAVLAYKENHFGPASIAAKLSASSAQPQHPATHATDGQLDTFWVSNGTEAGQGPTPTRPQSLSATFEKSVTVSEVVITGRPGHGPRAGEVQVSLDGKSFHTVRTFTARGDKTIVKFQPVEARVVRLLLTGAFDSTANPRNVQIAEFEVSGPDFAWPGNLNARLPLKFQAEKALLKSIQPFSAPDTSFLFQENPATAGEADAQAGEMLDLTAKCNADGVLTWAAPPGKWVVLRFGYTLNDRCRVSTSSAGWTGYALDPYDGGAFQRYWNAVVEPLIAEVGPLAGKSLKYLHTDSWEIGVANWTPTLSEEFQKRRGYELLPWLPVIAGKIVNSREESNRFLQDFRRTMGDLAIDNHYRIFRDAAHKHGLLIHPESGGPHAVPIDAQQCLGFDDAPMSEFWAWSWTHRVGDANRFFVKQPASAAHTYGRKLVMAEGFTTIGPHWQETLWDNLKPSFDKANCEGLNLLVWHAFVCSPKEQGIPGQQYFAGTHLNPNVTWWEKSAPFFAYINRCQALLQEGLPFADALYYYGNDVPNFAQRKAVDPAKVGIGFDYDVITEEALISRASVRNGRIVLPDGVSYRVLTLVDRDVISIPVLRKVKELVDAGATVVGPRPHQASGLKDWAQSDAEVNRLADELWGKGRIVSNQTTREVLLGQGVRPDLEWTASAGSAALDLDFIHRTADGAEIYFVANRTNVAGSAVCTFRVADKAPELWNPMTGEHWFAAAYENRDGRTTVPLEFAPCGSWFVVFRESSAQHPARGQSNSPELKPLAEVGGSWTVKFDPHWGGPALAEFPKLVSWTERTEPGIRHYSGTALYTKTIQVPAAENGARVLLDLGRVRELAEVRVNGKSCGIVWAPPFRVDITDAVKPGANALEVEVVNFWPNRIIGDAALPEAQRFTRTNVRVLKKDTELMESGLIGPVRLISSGRLP